ncbi:MAG: hypothetical protein U9R79_11880 [Armatimonadota bacterium]|nr:hypothetical protein [Armatimonadota bacterium]
MAAVVAFLSAVSPPAHADRVLAFGTATGAIGGVATAEVHADGLVLMRLRSPRADELAPKAELVASRLTDLAVEGLAPGELAVQQVAGQWAVTGAGELIVTADPDTVAASGLEARDLCESWRKRLAEVLREPYLVIEPADTVLVPVGERRSVRVGGTVDAGRRAESLAPDVVRAAFEGRKLVLQGRNTGTTVVAISAGELEHALTVEVKRWAARMIDSAAVRTAGGGLSEAMARAAALNAALFSISPEPQAVVHLVSANPTKGGYSLDLRAGGPDYIPVSGQILVRFRAGLPVIPPAHALLMSNYPEKVAGVGALMRQPLERGHPARLMWHHKNYAGHPLVMAVRLINRGQSPARVRIGWAEAGPDRDEIFVGYNAMLRYWQAVRAGSCFEARIPSCASFEAVTTPIGYHEVVSGMMDVVADEGEEVYVEVAARDRRDVPRGFGRVPHHGDEMPVTPFEFPASLDRELSYEVGGPYGHLSIGREEVVNDEGVALAGAYGVMHNIRVALGNPAREPGRVELAVRAGGGVARTITAVDGALTSTRLLLAGQEEVLATRDLPPGGRGELRVQMMPAAGSNLPLTLVVRGRTR